MKKLVLFVFLVSFVIAGSKKHEGYYFGVIPCEDCKGIATWIYIKGKEYEMVEKFLGLKNEANSGKLKFVKRTTFTLEHAKDKIFRIYKKFLQHNKTKLNKLRHFDDQNSTLLVDEKSLLRGRSNGKKVVKFNAMLNYEIPTENGYKSKKANYLLHCKKKKYEISRVSCYAKKYSLGGFVYANESTRGQFDIVKNSSLYKAYRKYCK